MFVRINQSCVLSFIVKDKNNNAVSDDVPYCTIKERATGKYYNGLIFDDGETRLQMRYIMNGLYTLSFTPESVSVFDVFCRSDEYEISTSFSVESYDVDGLPEYKWQKDEQYDVTIPVEDGQTECSCSIMRVSDDKYYSKNGWEANPVNIPMQKIENIIWMYQFVPAEYDEYVITIGETSYKLVVEEGVKKSHQPIMASSSSIRFSDGTDTVCLTKNNEPLQGVTVTAYSKVTKEVVGKTTTRVDGTWSLLLPQGDYVFVFAKDKYSSVSIERSLL